MTTPILSLPEIAESQAGKSYSHNEALNRLEGVLVRVLSATTTAEPGSPSEGDTYIVPDSATGTDWAGNDGKIAHYYGGAWHFYAPVEGLAIYSTGDAKSYRYLSSTWSEDVSGGASEDVSGGASAPRNYLINPDFAINQRGFSGDALAVGEYGYDRWRSAGVGLIGARDVDGYVALTSGDPVPYADAIDALAPVAYWRFGEASGTTCVDEVGNTDLAYTGVTLGTAGLLVDDADTAATWDGSPSYASAVDLPAAFLGPSYPTAMSIAFLIKFATVAGNQLLLRIDDAGATSNAMINLQLRGDTTGQLSFDKYLPGGGAVYSNLQPVADTVYHIVWTEDATGLRLYVDGALDKYEPSPETYSGGAMTRMQIGYNIGQAGYSFLGVMDEFAMFDTALSAADVSDLYDAAQATLIPDAAAAIAEQEIEAPDLAGKQVTLAADTGGTTVTGDIDGTSGNLPLTVTIDPGSTGNIIVACTGGQVKNLRLVEGADAGLYQPRDPTLEHQLCRRYYAKSYPKDTAPGSVGAGNAYCFALTTSKSLQMGNVMAPVEMRASPTVTLYSPNDGTADAIYNETGTANHVAAAVNTTKNCIGYPQIDAGASAPSADDLFAFHWTADAEI